MTAPAAATAHMQAVHVPLPPSYDEPSGWFLPVVEPEPWDDQPQPSPVEETTAKLVPVAHRPGLDAAALVYPVLDPLVDCLPAEAGLLADLADEKPLTYRYLVRSLGWDGMPAEDPFTDLVSRGGRTWR
jgi:hypothetical protein